MLNCYKCGEPGNLKTFYIGRDEECFYSTMRGTCDEHNNQEDFNKHVKEKNLFPMVESENK